MSYPIAVLEHFAPGLAAALKRAGIRTTGKLVESAKDPKERLAAKIGVDGKRILRWTNIADGMRIKGIGEHDAALLEGGVDAVRELQVRKPRQPRQGEDGREHQVQAGAVRESGGAVDRPRQRAADPLAAA